MQTFIIISTKRNLGTPCLVNPNYDDHFIVMNTYYFITLTLLVVYCAAYDDY